MSTEAARHLKRAEHLSDLGRADRALEEAKAALALDPSNAAAWFHCARALVLADRFTEALEHVEQGLAREPDNPWGHRLRSVCLSGANRLEEALEAIDRATVLSPDEPLNHRRKARILLWLDRPAEALPCVLEATRLNPNDVHNHLVRGRVALRLSRDDPGQLAVAEEAARKACACDPEQADACALLGEVLGHTGDRVGAVEAWVAALRLDPTKETVRSQAKAAFREVLKTERGVAAGAAVAGLGGVLGLSIARTGLLPVGAVVGLGVGGFGGVLAAVSAGGALQRLEERIPGAIAVYKALEGDAWEAWWLGLVKEPRR